MKATAALAALLAAAPAAAAPRTVSLPSAPVPGMTAPLAPAVPDISAIGGNLAGPAAVPGAAPIARAAEVPAIPTLPAAAPAAPAAPAALAAPAAPPAAAGAQQPSPEAETAAGGARFDGGTPKAPGEDDSEWSHERFESADGASVAFKRRAGSGKAPARVFAGGLALNESFDPLLAGHRSAGHEYFLWTRGHPPTAWEPTRVVIDADARDLARMILKAAAANDQGKVEVALHSFGTLVFQRLVQLRDEPEAAQALKALRGQRVFLLNATTHYEGSERNAGPELEQMGTATKQFVGWLDLMDATAADWEAAAELNPFVSPAIKTWLAGWYAQRAQVLAMASSQAATMMKKDLETPWPPEIDPIRLRFIAALRHDHRDGGWQEALLRRSADMFRLEFTKDDVAALRKAGIRLELVHAVDDQLLNWGSARTLFERLGIAAPKQAPPAGTILTDASGLFRARIVEGDHYFPLKRRDELARIMTP